MKVNLENIDDIPSAASVHIFLCENPECLRPHIVLADEYGEPFAMFVVPDGWVEKLKAALYEAAVGRKETEL
jgi:hypothetical protein